MKVKVFWVNEDVEDTINKWLEEGKNRSKVYQI